MVVSYSVLRELFLDSLRVMNYFLDVCVNGLVLTFLRVSAAAGVIEFTIDWRLFRFGTSSNFSSSVSSSSFLLLVSLFSMPPRSFFSHFCSLLFCFLFPFFSLPLLPFSFFVCPFRTLSFFFSSFFFFFLVLFLCFVALAVL